jgi:hypothetical protein
MTSPTPKISESVVADAATAARIHTSEALRCGRSDVFNSFTGKSNSFEPYSDSTRHARRIPARGALCHERSPVQSDRAVVMQ